MAHSSNLYGAMEPAVLAAAVEFAEVLERQAQTLGRLSHGSGVDGGRAAHGEQVMDSWRGPLQVRFQIALERELRLATAVQMALRTEAAAWRAFSVEAKTALENPAVRNAAVRNGSIASTNGGNNRFR